MNKIDKEIRKMVNDVLCKEARPEALVILEKCSEKHFNEFLQYYKDKKENICCMVLDSAKYDLVKTGYMIHSENDHFGSPYLETIQKEI